MFSPIESYDTGIFNVCCLVALHEKQILHGIGPKGNFSMRTWKIDNYKILIWIQIYKPNKLYRKINLRNEILQNSRETSLNQTYPYMIP
jgi:hypothetical protein